MSFADYSIASSATLIANSTNLPKSRIKCSRDQITVGESSFMSASDALVVYLQQYDVSMRKDVRIMGQGYGNKSRELLQDRYSVTSSHKISDNGTAGMDLVLGRVRSNSTDGSEDVDSLLISQISSSELHKEVTDDFRKIKLQHLIKQATLRSQSQAKTDLQREVEAALLRSAQLLEKVTKDDISFTSMLSRDTIMLSGDTNNFSSRTLGNDSLASHDNSEIGEKQSGHVYSYRTSRPRRSPHKHLYVHNPVLYHVHQQPRELRRCASIDNLSPASHRLPPRGKRSFNSSSNSVSYQSDPTDILRRVRSRSVSPGLRNPSGSFSAPGWVERVDDQSARKHIPSWVGELSSSEVSDSLWNSKYLLESRNNRKPHNLPSWIGEVDDSKLCEASTFRESRPLIPRMSEPPGSVKGKDRYNSVTSNGLDYNSVITTDSRPGLNFSDLVISDTCSPVIDKEVTFLNSVRNENSSLKKYQQRHSLTAQTKPPITYSDNLTYPQHSRMLDSEYNGEAFLNNNILPQTARLKKSMDNFVASSENLRRKSLSSNLSVTSSDPQCSSLDTLSLLTGKPLLRADVLAAISVPKDGTVASQSYSTSTATKPHERSSSPTHSGQDQNSSDGLDGDRPWEMMAGTFKPPVPVASEDLADRYDMSPGKSLERTLSGRKQHGSMETLKNMLFKLQAEESSTQEGSAKNEDTSFPSQTNSSQSIVGIIPALHNYDFKQQPGGQSLEKALVHLDRLKKLVQSTAASGSCDETIKTDH